MLEPRKEFSATTSLLKFDDSFRLCTAEGMVMGNVGLTESKLKETVQVYGDLVGSDELEHWKTLETMESTVMGTFGYGKEMRKNVRRFLRDKRDLKGRALDTETSRLIDEFEVGFFETVYAKPVESLHYFQKALKAKVDAVVATSKSDQVTDTEQISFYIEIINAVRDYCSDAPSKCQAYLKKQRDVVRSTLKNEGNEEVRNFVSTVVLSTYQSRIDQIGDEITSSGDAAWTRPAHTTDRRPIETLVEEVRKKTDRR